MLRPPPPPPGLPVPRQLRPAQSGRAGAATLLAFWLAAGSAGPGYAAPMFVSPEVRFGEATTPTLQPTRQGRPAVATGDGVTFLVWVDEREGEGRFLLYGAAVPEGGTLAATRNFPVAREELRADRPAVAFGARQFAVAWEDVDARGVFAARFEPSGRRLDAAPVALTGAIDCSRPAIAFDGVDFVVALECDEDDGPKGIVVQRLSTVGVPGQPRVVDSSDGASRATVSCLEGAAVPAPCLVAWQKPSAYGDRVQAIWIVSNQVGPELSFALATPGVDQYRPRTLAAGSNVRVLWLEGPGNELKLRSALVSPAGTLSTAVESFWFGGNELDRPELEAAALSDDRVLVSGSATIQSQRRLFVRPLSGGPMFFGTAPATEEQRLASSGLAPFGPDAGLVVWTQGTSERASVVAAVVPPVDGIVGVPLAVSSPTQLNPAVAEGPLGALVGWVEWKDGGADVLISKVLLDGGLSAAPPVLVAGGDGDQRALALAVARTTGFAVWTETSSGGASVRGRSVAADGSLASGSVIDFGTASEAGVPVELSRPAVAASAGLFLVAHVGSDGGPPALFVDLLNEAAVASGAPEPRPKPVPLGADAGQVDSSPSVASVDGGFVVAWRATSPASAEPHVWTSFVQATLASNGLAPPAVDVGSTSARSPDDPPSVACSPTSCLVAWVEPLGGGDAHRVISRALDLRGRPLGAPPTVVASSAGGLRAPAVVAAGDAFVVVWVDHAPVTRSEARAMRVSSEGALLDGAPFVVGPAGGPSTLSRPVLAASGGLVWLAYSAFDDAPEHQTHRLRARLLVDPSAPEAAGLDAALLGPGIEASPASELWCSKPFRFPTTGSNTARGPGPVRWHLAAGGDAPVPPGLTVDEDSGVLMWTPPPEAAGLHRVGLTAQGNGWVDALILTLDVRCTQRAAFASCGCRAVGGEGASLGPLPAALALLLRGLRPRAQRAQQKEHAS